MILTRVGCSRIKRKVYMPFTSATAVIHPGSLGDPDYLLVVMLRRAAIRSSRGGCVLKRPVKTPPAESGFTMNSAEVAGGTSMGMRLL